MVHGCLLRHATAGTSARHPLELVVLVVGPSRRAGWVPFCVHVPFGVDVVVVIIFEKITVYVAQLNELNFWWLRAKVEGSDFDGSDERRSCGTLKLSVEDNDERRRERSVELVPVEVDRHCTVTCRAARSITQKQINCSSEYSSALTVFLRRLYLKTGEIEPCRHRAWDEWLAVSKYDKCRQGTHKKHVESAHLLKWV